MAVKFDVLLSSGLGETRGGAETALPSTGTTNPMASSSSVVAKPGAVPDLVVTTSPIHGASLTFAPTLRKCRGLQGSELGESCRRMVSCPIKMPPAEPPIGVI